MENVMDAAGLAITVTERRVDWTRGLARRLLDHHEPDAVAVFDLVKRDAEDAVAAGVPVDELRAWQILVSNVAGALRPIDANLSEDARRLAGRLRSQVGLVSRNPAERLATRPASRRVLEALLLLGGRGPLATIRERSGMGQTHLSNVVKALLAHKFITMEPDPEDGRSKLVSLTVQGRQAVSGAELRSKGKGTFRTYVVDSERRPMSGGVRADVSRFHSDLREVELS